MSKENESMLFEWANTPPPEIAIKFPVRPDENDLAELRRLYRNVDRALSEAKKYHDLNAVFAEFLAHYEVTIEYCKPRYNFGNEENATKLDIKPKDGVPSLGIKKGAGFFTFTDCLTFAAQSFLSGEEGFGLHRNREVAINDIDTWIRRRHRVRLLKDEEKRIILEAQREYDHVTVLRIIGNDFVMCLIEFHSEILGEDILKRAEDSKIMFGQDGNTPPAPVVINL